MPVCEVDLRVGGAYRYVWRRDTDGQEIGMGGVYREIVAPKRIVSTEKFDQAWYREADPPLRLTGSARRRAQVRDVAASYDRLEGVLAEMAAR